MRIGHSTLVSDFPELKPIKFKAERTFCFARTEAHSRSPFHLKKEETLDLVSSSKLLSLVVVCTSIYFSSMLRVFYRLQQQTHHYIKSLEPKTRIYNLGFLAHLQNSNLSTISTTPSSKTIDYLVKSCGLDPKTALSASKKVQLTSTEKPDKVLTVLRGYGIDNTHLVKVVSKNPKILNCDLHNTLKPKIDFLHNVGVSGPDIAKILICGVGFNNVGLESKIIPASNFLKRLFTSHTNFVLALKHSIRHFHLHFETVVAMNIATLHSYGVQECNILYILKNYPRALIQKNDRVKTVAEAVLKMGFDPSRLYFTEAVRVMCTLSESSWNRRWAAYNNLGFSDEEILSIFKKQPFCLMISDEKMQKSVDFFTQKLKLKVADICLYPLLLQLSLEKRIIPRYNVLKLLNSKGIMKKKKMDVRSLHGAFKLPEKDFLTKFVVKNQLRVPEVVNAYKCGTGSTRDKS